MKWEVREADEKINRMKKMNVKETRRKIERKKEMR